MATRRLGAIAHHVANPSGSRPSDVDEQTPHAAAVGAAAGGELQLPQGVLDAYVTDGYVLLGGLIPDDVLQHAHDETWAVMCGSAPTVEGDPYQHLEQHGPVLQHDRSTWPDGSGWHGLADNATIAATVTPAVEAAAMQLIRAMAAADSRPLKSCGVPGEHQAERVLFLNTFPQRNPAEWSFPEGGHVDLSLISLDRLGDKTPPRRGEVRRVVTLQTIIYLSAAADEGGGGTIVWPGSHQLLRERHREQWVAAWAEQEPADQLSVQEVSVAAGPLTRVGSWEGVGPVEVVPRAGSVLFYDALCVHTGSANVRSVPRLAVAQKW